MAETSAKLLVGLTTGPKSSTRITRRRNACLDCKRRKVRCIVLGNQASCTNCICNENNCHFPTPSKQLTLKNTKSSKRELHANIEIIGRVSEYLQEGARFPRKQECPSDKTGTIDNFYKSVLREFLELDESLQPIYPDHNATVARTINDGTETPFCHSQLKRRLFEFSVLSNIPADEYDYLYIKGALNMPSVSLRNQILRAYISWVHPMLPLLDLPDFLQRVILNNDCEFNQPLLYQAVMFAGSSFLDSKDVRLSGYNTLQELRRDLFERTKLLYEFDTEPDPFIQTQALLLLTNWYSLTESRDPWYWLSLAISAARRAGLHDQPYSNGEFEQAHSIRRRVWWCLYVRDKIISLGVRKPVQLVQKDYNVLEPQIQDLTANAIDDPNLYDVLGSSAAILTAQYQPLLGMLYLKQVQLGHCIGAIIEHIYHGSWVPGATSSVYCPLIPKSRVHKRAVIFCENLLTSWISGVPSPFRSHETFLTLNPNKDDIETVILFHMAYLGLLYRTARIALHHPLRMHEDSTPNIDTLSPGITAPMNPSESLALEITNILESLDHVGLLSFLPGTSVTLVLFSVASHLRGCTSNDAEIRSQAQMACRKSRKLAEQLLQQYPAAELVLALISQAPRWFLPTREASSILHGQTVEIGGASQIVSVGL